MLHALKWFSPVPGVISLCLLPGLSCLVVPGALLFPCWQLQKPIREMSYTGTTWYLGRRACNHGVVSSRGGSYNWGLLNEPILNCPPAPL